MGEKDLKLEKACFVPACPNTSLNSDKLFLPVPNTVEKRVLWFQAVNLPINTKKLHCCEDHFNFKEDAISWGKDTKVGTRLLLKPSVVPHLNLTRNDFNTFPRLGNPDIQIREKTLDQTRRTKTLRKTEKEKATPINFSYQPSEGGNKNVVLVPTDALDTFTIKLPRNHLELSTERLEKQETSDISNETTPSPPPMPHTSEKQHSKERRQFILNWYTRAMTAIKNFKSKLTVCLVLLESKSTTARSPEDFLEIYNTLQKVMSLGVYTMLQIQRNQKREFFESNKLQEMDLSEVWHPYHLTTMKLSDLNKERVEDSTMGEFHDNFDIKPFRHLITSPLIGLLKEISGNWTVIPQGAEINTPPKEDVKPASLNPSSHIKIKSSQMTDKIVGIHTPHLIIQETPEKITFKQDVNNPQRSESGNTPNTSQIKKSNPNNSLKFKTTTTTKKIVRKSRHKRRTVKPKYQPEDLYFVKRTSKIRKSTPRKPYELKTANISEEVLSQTTLPILAGNKHGVFNISTNAVDLDDSTIKNEVDESVDPLSDNLDQPSINIETIWNKCNEIKTEYDKDYSELTNSYDVDIKEELIDASFNDLQFTESSVENVSIETYTNENSRSKRARTKKKLDDYVY